MNRRTKGSAPVSIAKRAMNRTHRRGCDVCATRINRGYHLFDDDRGDHGEDFEERFDGNGKHSIGVGLAAPGIA